MHIINLVGEAYIMYKLIIFTFDYETIVLSEAVACGCSSQISQENNCAGVSC